MLLSLVLCVPLLLLIAAGIVMTGGEAPRSTRAKAAAYPIGSAFLGAIGILVLVTSQGPVTVRFYDPSSVVSFIIPIGFYVDRLSAVMMTLITGVSTIIYYYSTRYMYQDRHTRRYLTLICLTDFVLICMVSSGNLMMLFLFWQILSYLLYLLAHNHVHAATLAGAFKTFTLLRVADTAFLAGIVLAYQLYGTLEFQELFARAADIPVTLSILPGMDVSAVTAVTFLLFIGAMGKSAQFPLHLWLPGSLFAPTPVHALLHAGIINAGGFLINRLAPLFGMSSTTLHVAFVIGTLTAALGATMMLAQNDIKKTLGFSTIGQMGYMIMECGLGAFSLAVFHLIAHGLFKATVFLNCGNVIHKARQEPHFPHTDHENDEAGFSRLAWLTGFVTTLFIPLLILLVTHGVLRIPLLESQGTVIILFFIWITSSQAILTLTRLRAVASWKVSAIMLLTLLFTVFVYLFAVESFTAFLYPNPEEVASYFKAADLPDWLFDLIVVMAAIMTIFGWTYLYLRAHGRTVWMPVWIEAMRIRLYTVFLNRMYADELYQLLGSTTTQLVHRIDKLERGWSR
ncbi:NADH-quinone oxidoreductase subunit 5 family protein [Candidatus Nitrospira nitrificans]|uniref:Putative NADH-quinone oxidoreductase, subunit L n=1 Tax=Candidatus Nitrospira nitrificans TaxID=1742973 RepID=A0A0S4LID3_9BACT|nr:proton-conducting transporter membrane subunit [Candidatus Nitrospira nitrificans]CUS36336.1 putative NADH-quinone oxidoreductase, subunit L [Candidatus Nitrospira nitrificans]